MKPEREDREARFRNGLRAVARQELLLDRSRTSLRNNAGQPTQMAIGTLVAGDAARLRAHEPPRIGFRREAECGLDPTRKRIRDEACQVARRHTAWRYDRKLGSNILDRPGGPSSILLLKFVLHFDTQTSFFVDARSGL